MNGEIGKFGYVGDFSILLQVSLGGSAADLREGRLESDELIAYAHHILIVVLQPVLHVVPQIPQGMLEVLLAALFLYDVTEGSDFHLELDSWANVCLAIGGHILNLPLQIIECILEIFYFGHLAVLGRKVCLPILSLLLHVLEVGQRSCSVCLSLILCFWRVPDRRLLYPGLLFTKLLRL